MDGKTDMHAAMDKYGAVPATVQQIGAEKESIN
jgi:hypothetical protein